MMRNRIVIFARQPVPGQVKTRLASSLGDGRAADFYLAMLRDTLLMAQSVAQTAEAQVEVAYTPRHAFGSGADSLRRHWDGPRLPQSDGDLGEKMLHCISALQDQGAERVLLIGSDTPDLPMSFMHRAFHELKHCPVVLGPARDGGFYLLGAACRLPAPLFADVPWSASGTLAAALRNAGSLRLRTRLLRSWRDVDSFADVVALRRRLCQGHSVAPHSLAWLKSHGFA